MRAESYPSREPAFRDPPPWKGDRPRRACSTYFALPPAVRNPVVAFVRFARRRRFIRRRFHRHFFVYVIFPNNNLCVIGNSRSSKR